MGEDAVTAKVKKQLTYWLAARITSVLQDRSTLLLERGYEVSFCSSLDELTSFLDKRRAGIIIVSDDFGNQETEHIVKSLMTMPEVEGARMVMVRYGHSEALNVLAACANFRDLIPAELEAKQWMHRFIYATGGSPTPYVQPAGQVTLNNISAMHLPARITRLSGSTISIECRARPPTGTTLSLHGPLADAAGVNSISLTVVETQRRHLLYRFSDGIIATWQVPSAAKPKVMELLTQLYSQDTGPRCRVLLAAQTAAVRTQATAVFTGPQFELSTAMRKQGIIDSASFFTPDLVVIESSLCSEGGGKRFHQLMECLSLEATVLIIGPLPDFAALSSPWPMRHIMIAADIPADLPALMESRYLVASKTQALPGADRTANLTKNNPFSCGEVSFPVRLHRIHSQTVQIAMPYLIGNFALGRLETPLLNKTIGRSPFIKVTATYEDTHPGAAPFTHLAEGYFADLSVTEQRTLAGALVQLVTASLNRFDQKSGLFGASRTPELGSVRLAAALPNASTQQSAQQSAQQSMNGPKIAGNHSSAEAHQKALAQAVTEHHQALREAAQPEAMQVREAKPEIALSTVEATAVEEAPERRPVAPSKPRMQAAPIDFNAALRGIVVAALTAILLFILIRAAANHVDKSGSNYSNQLEKFAQPKNDQP